MKEKADSPRARKSTPKTGTTANKKASLKDASPAAKPARSKKAPAAASADPEKKPARVSRRRATTITPSADDVAVAAFLNWCQRRNQGLPDDPLADWIMAESEMGLAN
jgi:hypothetical protein